MRGHVHVGLVNLPQDRLHGFVQVGLVRPVAIGAKESLSALAIPITSSSTDVSRTLETDVSPTRPRTRSKLAGVGVVGWSGGVVAVGQGVPAPVGDAEHQQGEEEEKQEV